MGKVFRKMIDDMTAPKPAKISRAEIDEEFPWLKDSEVSLWEVSFAFNDELKWVWTHTFQNAGQQWIITNEQAQKLLSFMKEAK